MLLSLLVLFLQAAAQDSSMSDDGDPSCPCINATEILSRAGTRSCAVEPLMDTIAPHNCNGDICFDDSLCYPTFYGSSRCAPHDKALDPFCSDTDPAPAFCGQPWCWVDLDRCPSKSVRRSNYYSSEDLRLYYSYETCGGRVGEESWIQRVTSTLTLSHLRIAVSNLYYPMHFKLTAANSSGQIVAINYHPDAKSRFMDDKFGIYAGPFVDMINAILALPGCTIQSVSYHHRTDSSKSEAAGSLGSSSHAAVALDVNKGLVDTGIGSIWTTLERLERSGFSTPLFVDTFYLWSPVPDASASVSLLSVFSPFRADGWIGFLVALIVVALIQLWLEAGITRPTPAAGTQRRANDLPPDDSRSPAARGPAITLNETLYGAWGDFLGGMDPSRFHGWASRILGVGWGFFCLVFTATYTAELTSALIKQKPTGWWESMRKAQAANKVICATRALRSEFLQVWPMARWAFQDGFIETMVAFAEGRCDAVVLATSDVNVLAWVGQFICSPQEWYERGWAADHLSWAMNATATDASGRAAFPRGPLVRSSEPVLEIPVAMPVSTELAAPLSLWIKRLASPPANRDFLSFAKSYWRPSDCYPLTGPLGAGGSDPTGADLLWMDPQEAFQHIRIGVGMSFLELLGSFWFLSVFVLVACLMKVLHVLHHSVGASFRLNQTSHEVAPDRTSSVVAHV